MFPQLAFDFGRVADEIKLVDLMIGAKRHHGASYEIRRAEIAAHRIQGDLHWWETLRTKASDCKAKNGGTCVKRLLSHVGSWHNRRFRLLPFERQHLSPTVITTRRTSSMGYDCAATLRAFV